MPENPKNVVSALEVVEIETSKVVHTVDVRGQSDRGIERIMRGMLINMDRDRFFVREAEAPKGS